MTPVPDYIAGARALLATSDCTINGEPAVVVRVAELNDLVAHRMQAEAERDAAYRERAHLVAWLAALHPAVIAPAPDVDEPGWQIVYVYTGRWQMSWHISPRDADLFARVPHVEADDPRARWDGHTTDQKYARIRQRTRLIWIGCGSECAEGHVYAGRCELAARATPDNPPTSGDAADNPAVATPATAGHATVTVAVTAPDQDNADRWAGTIRDLVQAEHGHHMRLDITIGDGEAGR